MATSKKVRYSALRPYGFASGTVAEGETVELSEDDAARGLASGALVPTPAPSKAARKAADPEETP